MKTGAEIRSFGADLGRPEVGRRPMVEGEDYPRGLMGLDVEWFLRQVTAESVVACKTDEALRDLRTKSDIALRLRTLQEAVRDVQ